MKRRVFIIALFFLILSHNFAQTNNRARQWIDEAKQYIGTPYLYGGMSKNGIDCSGFIHITALNGIQLSLPRTTTALYDWVKIISDAQKEAGDLVFFKTVGSSISHVGLYMGNNQFIHAASSGPNTGVIVSSLSESYWAQRYAGVGRVLEENTLTQNTQTKNTTTSAPKTESSNQNKKNDTETTKSKSSFGFLYNDYIQFEAGLSADWSFYNTEYVFLSTRGFSAHAFLQTKKFPNNFGLGVDFNYDSFLSVFHIPLYFSIEINPNLKIYTGPVFSLGSARIDEGNNEVDVKAPIYPLFMGISFESDVYNFFGMKGYLFQKINYTYYKTVTNEALSFYNAYRSSLVFKTGLQILL